MKRTAIVMTVLLVLAMVAGMAADASANTIVSDAFSIGYGFTVGGWDDTETSGSNTGVTGDFSLTVTATSGGSFSSAGPMFQNRVLTDWSGASVDYCGKGIGTLFTIGAAYTGALGGDGATPFTLVIDSISIYAGNYDSASLTNTDTGGTDLINWSETTVDNIGASAQLDLGTAYVHRFLAAKYDQLSWNPGDVAVAGTSGTRIFALEMNDELAPYVDGFEVSGHIEFNAVPEPTTMVLLGIGALGFLRRGKR